MQSVFAVVRRGPGQGDRIILRRDLSLCLRSRDAEILRNAAVLVCCQTDCHDIARIAHEIFPVVSDSVQRIVHRRHCCIQIQRADIIRIFACLLFRRVDNDLLHLASAGISVQFCHFKFVIFVRNFPIQRKILCLDSVFENYICLCIDQVEFFSVIGSVQIPGLRVSCRSIIARDDRILRGRHRLLILCRDPCGEFLLRVSAESSYGIPLRVRPVIKRFFRAFLILLIPTVFIRRV